MATTPEQTYSSLIVTLLLALFWSPPSNICGSYAATVHSLKVCQLVDKVCLSVFLELFAVQKYRYEGGQIDPQKQTQQSADR